MPIPKDNSQLENARRLRREMTPHERKIWYLFLRKYPVKIYKQRIIGRFIVDFYCASARLVIELDGSQHYEPQGLAYDAERSQFLMALGLEVLRFSNWEIDRDFCGVCAQIDLMIQKKAAGPSQSPAVTALQRESQGGCTPLHSVLAGEMERVGTDTLRELSGRFLNGKAMACRLCEARAGCTGSTPAGWP